MKKLLILLLLTLSLAGCDGAHTASDPAGSTQVLKVAATAVPHAEILKAIKPLLAKQGIDLQVKVFADYVQPNEQVVEKSLDVNYFQTEPYLDAYNAQRGTNLVTIAGIHIEPFGAYSHKYHSISELPDGASVALPNDPSNDSRALLLLAKHGLISLRDPDNQLSTVKDISANPHHFQFKEMEAAMLPRTLDEVDLALINTNYALSAGLNPVKDALLIEDKNSPYVNYLVGRPDNRDDPRVKALVKALTSPEARNFIETTYHGAVLPAF